MTNPLRRALLAMVALLSTVAVLTIEPTPAGACVDWVAPTVGDLGFIPSEGFFGGVDVAPDGTIVTGRDRFTEWGELLNTYPFEENGAVVKVLDDGDVILAATQVARFTIDGTPAPGFTPFTISSPAVFGVAGSGHMATAGPSGQSFDGTIGEVRRRLPDGSLDTAFAGTGAINIVLDLGDNNPGDQARARLVHPNDTGGVDIVVLWSQTQPGYAFEYVRVDPNGSVTVLGWARYEGEFPVETDRGVRTDNTWEFVQMEFPGTSSDSRRAVVIRLELESGEFEIVRTLPRLPDSLNGGPHMAIGEDGLRLVTVIGAYAILGEESDPLMSNGRSGDWVPIDDPDQRNSGRQISGVTATPGGGFLMSFTGPVESSGLYALRGSAPPEFFIQGGLTDQVARLYRAGLGRQPDADGLVYFSNLRARGASLEAIAYTLVVSDEFRSNFGTLSDREFVEQLYRFVLGRPGDVEGIDYWTGILQEDSRAAVLAFFSESRENVILSGSLQADPAESAVYRLYRAVFLRPPDVSGHCFWVLQLDAGSNLASLASAFVQSPEFTLLYGDLDNGEFVEKIYRNVLGRAGDADGISYWTGLLDGGARRGDVVVGFSESAEFRLLTDTVGR